MGEVSRVLGKILRCARELWFCPEVAAACLRRSVNVWGAVFVPMVYYSYVSRGRRVRSREKAKKRISGESLLYGWVNEGEGEIYFKSSTIKEISVAATCEARL